MFLEFGGERTAAGRRGALAECRGGVLPGGLRGAAGRYPGGLQLGTRVASGDHPGKTRAGHVAHTGASGEFTLAGLAAHLGASGRVLLVWVLGTRGVLARHPEDSLGVALGVGFSGTRGSLELLPDVFSRFRHSGHVVL